MKQQKQYSRFICYSNAPVCAYGNKIISASQRRKRKSILRLMYFIFNKSSGP